MDSISNRVDTVYKEDELLQIAIEQLGATIDADYCWYTRHDAEHVTATIDCEYINTKPQIYPIDKIGREIDLSRYRQFYNHLFENEIWIDPPLEIIPQLYRDLAISMTQVLIFPIVVVDPSTADRQHQMIGEVGIITTGQPPWTTSQATAFANIFNLAVKLFRKTHQA